MNVQTHQTEAAVPATTEVDLDLSISIVTAGPVAAALLSSTDDGCDTLKNGDC
ncbi:FxLD family lantipeptide [Streptomyces sp. RFCAC02]|uniref:FxLD family lantipeptide n=1 Tax=Streptomyces sp. RFCAC02 TaxID=2499143 RepID=UPI001021E953|nr:FxLD family lantipeptide [Streptomyces sp. RFCAC02]